MNKLQTMDIKRSYIQTFTWLLFDPCLDFKVSSSDMGMVGLREVLGWKFSNKDEKIQYFWLQVNTEINLWVRNLVQIKTQLFHQINKC